MMQSERNPQLIAHASSADSAAAFDGDIVRAHAQPHEKSPGPHDA